MRTALILLCLIVVASFTFAHGDAEHAHVRIAHFAADAPNVDVWVDGEIVLEDVPASSISAFLELEPGEHSIALSPTGEEDAVIEAEVELEEGHSYSIAAIGSMAEDNLDALVIDETAAIEENDLSEGALIIMVNNITGAPSITFYDDDIVHSANVAPGTFVTTLVPSANWDTARAVASDDEETVIFDLDSEEDGFGGFWEPNLVYLYGLTGTYPGAMFEDYGIVDSHYSPADVVDLLAGFSGLGLSYDSTNVTEFNTLLAAIEAAGLTETLRESEGYTLFAPTDQAFAALPEGALDQLMSDPDALAAVLQNHVVEDDLTYDELIADESFTTMAGNEVTFTDSPDEFGAYLNDDVFMENFDYPAVNGRVYVLHNILLPDDMLMETEPMADTMATEEAEG